MAIVPASNVQESVARAMAPGSGPAWMTTMPRDVQMLERPAAWAKPPPVDPAKLATATQT